MYIEIKNEDGEIERRELPTTGEVKVFIGEHDAGFIYRRDHSSGACEFRFYSRPKPSDKDEDYKS